MKTLRCVIAVLLSLTGAQAQARDAERGRKIVEQAIKALGGQNYLNAREYRSEGRAFQFSSQEELAGMAPLTIYEHLPEKYRQEIGKHKEEIFVLNGQEGWDATFRGVQNLPDAEVERIRFNREMSVDNILRFRLKEEGLIVELVGTDLEDGRQVELVEISDAKNRVVKIAFDHSTHLPTRREWERPNPKTHEREQNVETLGKYLPVRGAGGVVAPYYIRRERNGIKIFETFLNEVRAGGVPDSLFARPSGPERGGGSKR